MNFRFQKRAIIAGLWIGALTALLGAEDRIRLPVVINGKQETFAFDTGFGSPLVLLRPTAERMGLKITPPPANAQAGPGKVLLDETEACTVTLLGRTETVPLNVLDPPFGVALEEAGIVGWPVLSREIVRFKATGNHEQLSSETVVPAEATGWLKARIVQGQTLMLEIPSRDDEPISLNVDTGAPDGVVLQADRFREWRKKNPRAGATLTARIQPAPGLMVSEEVWADEIALGQITLRNVPLVEGTPGDFRGVAPNTIAIVGMAALRRLDLVVDGRSGVAFVRPSQNLAGTYNHNRLGAVFVPRDAQSADLAAIVAPRSPAERAGVQDGDVLLKIDSMDVTEWRTKPGISPLSRFWTRPSGTRLTFTLKRGDKTMVVPVILEEILGPKSQKKK
jgi:hypothetical protein